MGTRVVYHQVNLCPSSPDADGNDTIEIPHVESGWCQCVGAEFIGGGGDKRFLLHLVVFEPYDEKEEEKGRKKRAKDDKDGESEE